MVQIPGDALDDAGQPIIEEVELWKRDPLECVIELFSNPSFRDVFALEPEQAFADQEGKSRIFDEVWTGNWWWKLQVSSGHVKR